MTHAQNFYDGREQPALALSGQDHEDLEPLLDGPLLGRIRHFYDDDSVFDSDELENLAQEIAMRLPAAPTAAGRAFMERLRSLALDAAARGAKILVVRD